MREVILVVEDQKNVREDIVEILHAAQYNVCTASCGENAVELVKSTIPDLVLSDIMMPGMDGYGLLSYFQKDHQLRNIPFIFLSAKSSCEDLRTGMKLGADDYLSKPFRAKDLLQSIEARLVKTNNWKKNLDKMRESFSLSVPHELRTPLIPLLGYSDIILEDIKKISKEEIYDLVERIKAGALRLHNRVEKLILLSSLQLDFNNFNEIKNIKSQSVDYPRELIITTVKTIANSYSRVDDLIISIEPEIEPLKIPEFYLTTLIKELVENACKFSDPGQEISVTGIHNGKFYELSFLNQVNGITCNINDHKNLLEYPGNIKEPKSGIGIGLFIIKKILEIIGGDISIKHSLNNINLVSIKIPFSSN